MMTIQEIKDQWAKSLNGLTWDQVIMDRSLFDAAVDEIAKRYATECAKASLEKAAHAIHDVDIFTVSFTARERSAITSPENITLL